MERSTSGRPPFGNEGTRSRLLVIGALVGVLGVAAVASALFVAQGGVGAGHMRFDQVIGILGLPWLWLLELIPWPESLWLGDDVMIVVLPLACNLAVVLVLWVLLKRRR